VAAPWKATIERWLRERPASAAGASPVREIMERARLHPELASVLSEIPAYVGRVAPLLRAEPSPPALPADESGLLRACEAYLLRRFRFRSIAVYEESEAAPHDPKGRRSRARPGRPAFFLFGGGPSGSSGGSVPPAPG